MQGQNWDMEGDKGTRGTTPFRVVPLSLVPTDHAAEAVLDLMAVEMERAYRRGFQQGCVIGKDIDPATLHAWRWRKSLTKAVCPDTRTTIPFIDTARDRLEIENPRIAELVAAVIRKARK